MELKRPTLSDLSRMSDADKNALILKLYEIIDELLKQVDELKSQCAKNSHNSSKPPSSDGLKKTQSTRQPSQRKTGGQTQHRGQTLTLSDDPDEIIDLRPSDHCECGRSLVRQASYLQERRQQIDIPEPKHIITEYRQWIINCRCGRQHVPVFPDKITPNVSYGSRIKAYAVGLVHGHFVSLKRTAQIIRDQYNIYPSTGTVQNWINEAQVQLLPMYQQCAQTIVHSPVAHFDESGVRVNGKLNWLHVAATSNAVYYSVHTTRGQGGIDAANILPQFTGCAVHDHWRAYWRYAQATHALCNAHHLRELLYVAELTGHDWPLAIKKLLIEGKKAVELAQAQGLMAVPLEQIESFSKRYDECIANGLLMCPVKRSHHADKRRCKQHVGTNLLIRLRDFKANIWRFIVDWQVPFDNNLAERMVRPVKVKLKVIGHFRAQSGMQAFCVIRSAWETYLLQQLNPFEQLRLVFEAE